MGGGTSKPTIDPTKLLQAPDIARASYSADYVQNLAKQNAEALKKALEVKKSPPLIDWSKLGFFRIIGILLVVTALIIVALLIYDLIARARGWRTMILPGTASSGSSTPTPEPPPGPNPATILYIDSATYGVANNTVDVTAKIQSMVVGPTYNSLPQFIVAASNLGISNDPASGVLNTLTITYHFGAGGSKTITANEGQSINISPPSSTTPAPSPGPASASSSSGRGGSNDLFGGSLKATVQPPPPLLRSMFGKFLSSTGGSSLQSSIQDATTSTTIPSGSAPLSVGSDGSYGMQWWMFVKDWNYGYGKEKTVIKRADPSSTSVTNPHISLHPTDNSLVITVSVFPATEGGASKSSPAPYGHSSATDDVFVCEVPNIPLQSWFSVSATVFGRNLDVYIDGKLVKSCFLPGVPKPAMGDVQLTPGGGFSGYVCEFTHFDRMLTPDDAIAFYNAGTSCQSATQPSAVSQATGYSVKFGVYDATGKEVKEYAF